MAKTKKAKKPTLKSQVESLEFQVKALIEWATKTGNGLKEQSEGLAKWSEAVGVDLRNLFENDRRLSDHIAQHYHVVLR